jgi:hypothetical protein
MADGHVFQERLEYRERSKDLISLITLLEDP